jgi:tetratricopeptide (TPR) repeat protein
MTTIGEMLSHGLRLHQGGDLAAAETIYRQLLQTLPDQIDALHGLGLLLHQRGQSRESLEHLSRAAELAPGEPVLHYNLALVHVALGRPAEAVAAFREAARLRPDFAEAHNNLGGTLLALSHVDDAIACHRRALELRPEYPEASNNLGVALAELRRWDEAIAAYRDAIHVRPSFAAAHNNLATALSALGRRDEALASCRQALTLQPAFPEALNNLGNILREVGQTEGAIASYRQAIRLRPHSAEAHNNLGRALAELGQLSEATACYRRALELRPTYAEAHVNRALVDLKQGHYFRGWSEWEWRDRCPGILVRRSARPRWDGSPLGGRAILIYAEQGLGDTLQFIRYAPLVKARGGRVVVECQRPLAPLLANSPGVDTVVAAGGPAPECAVELPLMSLPRVFETTLSTIPATIPYLLADPTLVARWRTELAGDEIKLGIAWQGNPNHPGDRRRSAPLSAFAPLAEIDGVRLVSLQIGPGFEQIATAGFPIVDIGERLTTFADTAAALQALDLVVAVDTAIVHCSGGLGVPIWVALAAVADWRWLLDREDSPWYRSVRLFRQRRAGDWADVFTRIVDEIRGKIART